MPAAATLADAFDDSIERLSRGQTLDDCLRAHPHFKAELRAMLEELPEVKPVELPPIEPKRTTQETIVIETAPKNRSFGRLSLLLILIVITAVVIFGANLLLDPIFGSDSNTQIEAPRDVIAPINDSSSNGTTSNDCPLPSGWVTYDIQAGDTLYDLAAATDSTVDDLRASNCMSPGDPLPIGYNLYLPRRATD